LFFYTASQKGFDSLQKDVHNWLNPKTTCSQFYGHTGTADTFNLVIDAFHDTKSPCTPSRGTKTFDKHVNAFGLGWVVDCWTPLTAENIVARHQYGH